jgi:hypothetical protein
MIPPFKLTKIIDEKEQHGESSCQTLNLALQNQNKKVAKQS